MNPSALTLEEPLEIDDARRASRRLAGMRRDAEQAHEDFTRQAAEKEQAYGRRSLRRSFRRRGRLLSVRLSRSLRRPSRRMSVIWLRGW
jgi:hypothetical protein